ncbi:hypothetical protein AOLI_G00204560 [Acnodon oligacanthus]
MFHPAWTRTTKDKQLRKSPMSQITKGWAQVSPICFRSWTKIKIRKTSTRGSTLKTYGSFPCLSTTHEA